MKTNTKPMKEDVKAFIITCFDELLEDGVLLAGRNSCFDHLENHGLLVLDGNQKRAYYQQARNELLRQDSMKPKKEQKPHLYSGSRSLTVIFKAKVLAVEDYFAKIDAECKHIKNILK